MLELISKTLFEGKANPDTKTSFAALIFSTVLFSVVVNLALTKTIFPMAFIMFFGLFILGWFAVAAVNTILYRIFLGERMRTMFRRSKMISLVIIPWLVLMVPWISVFVLDLYTGGLLYPTLVTVICYLWSAVILSKSDSKRHFRKGFKVSMLAMVILLVIIALFIHFYTLGELSLLGMLELF